LRLLVRDDGRGIDPSILQGVATVIGVCQECASVLDELELLSNCEASWEQELKSN